MRSHHITSWQPIFVGEQAMAIMRIVGDVAARLREQGVIEAAIRASARQTSFPHSTYWNPWSIAQGQTGLALAYCFLDRCFPQQDWAVYSHRALEQAMLAAQQEPYLPIGLFDGLSGMAFTAWYLSQDGKRYRKLLATLEEALLPRTASLARQVAMQPEPLSVGRFDLISGLSGIGAYLLCRKDVAQVAETLSLVLSSLVELSKERDGLPRWYTPVQLLGDQASKDRYPNGNLNCGLAHGIPGPLGLLSLAYCMGLVVEGIEDAIHRLATWLLEHRIDDEWGINWPTAIPLGNGGVIPVSTAEKVAAPFEPGRAAWCYGSPGLARSLWLAGKALGCTEYCDQAITAMEAVYRRPIAVRRIDSPTFCHGIAGLMQITLRFAHETGFCQFREAARTLGEQLLSLYDADTLLGYYCLEPGGNHVDRPGLLDGVPGVVLVLLAATFAIEPMWDRLFLLS